MLKQRTNQKVQSKQPKTLMESRSSKKKIKIIKREETWRWNDGCWVGSRRIAARAEANDWKWIRYGKN